MYDTVFFITCMDGAIYTRHVEGTTRKVSIAYANANLVQYTVEHC